MHHRKIFHAVLQIPKIAEEIFGHLGDGFDFGCGGDGGAGGGVFIEDGGAVRGGWVPDYESGDHDEEEEDGAGEHGEEIRVEADEGEGREGSEGVGRVAPLEDAEDSVLEDEDNADTTQPSVLAQYIKRQGRVPGVESPEVRAHERQTKRRAPRFLPLALVVCDAIFLCVVVAGQDALEELVEEAILDGGGEGGGGRGGGRLRGGHEGARVAVAVAVGSFGDAESLAEAVEVGGGVGGAGAGAVVAVSAVAASGGGTVYGQVVVVVVHRHVSCRCGWWSGLYEW